MNASGDFANLGSPLDQKLAGLLGGRTAAALHKAFGMVQVVDLLSHYPRRYAHRGELTALSHLPLEENVTLVAEVREVRERPMKARRGSILEVKISDGHGVLTLTFFNQAWRAKELKPGVRGIFAGKVSDYRGSLQLAHPDYELFDEEELQHQAAKEWAEKPIPLYPATASVASWQIQRSIELVLDSLAPLQDPVPAEIRLERSLIDFDTALRSIHRPDKDGDWRLARDSLRFQEAFVLQVALLQQRQQAHAQKTTARSPTVGGFLERFDEGLPFVLTEDQRLVGEEIAADLAQPQPMNRLVQGEVGSGKTLVALRAMLTVADTGGQAVLLAPTEVLAAQHFRSIIAALGPDLSAELVPTLHTGQLPTAVRKKTLLRLVSGQASIVIGTHALLSDAVQFYDLGLVIVDEQHRFGVEQRENLRLKGERPPHVLVLTATPIPRTVAMTVFGDLDMSTITELPAGRAGISSFVVPLAEKPSWISRVWQRTAEEVAEGRQAFVVCPAIEDASALEEDPPEQSTNQEGGIPVTSVQKLSEELQQNPLFAAARIGSLHGRMSSEQKEKVMTDFSAGNIDILVATTVIEVGVDVPNASTMVVMDADRFGMSQLHQLRGRVGRGTVPGICLLVTYAEKETLARQRVDAVASTSDGFALAQIDLELRREGDVLGSSQSGGRSSLRLLRVASDAELISEARTVAAALLQNDAELGEHPQLRAALARRLDDTHRAFLAKN